MDYKNFETLKKNKDFRKVYSVRNVTANRLLIMYITENNNSKNRLGVSVSKKVGNSVIRHRVVRLIREAYRLNVEKVSNGYDIVIVAKEDMKDKSYAETQSALMHLLKKHGIINNQDK